MSGHVCHFMLSRSWSGGLLCCCLLLSTSTLNCGAASILELLLLAVVFVICDLQPCGGSQIVTVVKFSPPLLVSHHAERCWSHIFT